MEGIIVKKKETEDKMVQAAKELRIFLIGCVILGVVILIAMMI